ncbi:Reverse transcriptase-rnase h-integrase [Phytophthora palmivora]|uniref:Reverse transcriptase-rnase h-integrase n=1 Tax=Phytophthora palmivora TaxID=4796 RepID=A0A2P4XHQ6_9STRA|nr:Reverse transcriptase-rnase h-integrase [Phytophthora palmivora]
MEDIPRLLVFKFQHCAANHPGDADRGHLRPDGRILQVTHSVPGVANGSVQRACNDAQTPVKGLPRSDDTEAFYYDIYIFAKPSRIEDHLDALRETLDILRDNKLYVKLFTLLKKKNKRDAKIHFLVDLLKNFKELKQRLCNPPVLHLPVSSQPMQLRTDVSKYAVGGVLFQVVNGVERPIAYISRNVKSAKLNYPTQR